jgi:hypothetical protein
MGMANCIGYSKEASVPEFLRKLGVNPHGG